MVKYDNHVDEWDNVLISGTKRQLIGDSWKKRTTLDSLSHDRQRSIFKKIIKFHKNATLLTVGDGRYGNDAKYFMFLL